MDATKSLAEFVIGLQHADLPKDVITRVKHSFVDTLACTLVGSTHSEGRAISRFVHRMGSSSQASVLGQHPFRTSPAEAALVNGVMAHVLDYDDTYSTISYQAVSNHTDLNDPAVGMTVGHMGACLLPSALAVGEVTKADGAKVLAAYAAGFEAACRLGHLMGLKHYLKGFHSTSTFGCMAAAATAAKLLDLDVQKTCMAFGLAAAQASGLRGNFGSMAKSLQAGNAARIGVLAAQLAKEGFTANPNIIGADLGYIDVLSFGGSREQEALNDTPEGGFHIRKGNTLKFFPCANALQSCVETILELVTEHDITASNVAGVETTLQMSRYRVCTDDGITYHLPSTGLEGKFVLPYCVTAAILDRKINLSTFTDAMVQRPQVAALFSKVSQKVDASAQHEKLVVRMSNGDAYESLIGKSKGHWSQTFPEDLLGAKYKDCAGQVLCSEDATGSLQMARDLESLDDIRDLITLVTVST